MRQAIKFILAALMLYAYSTSVHSDDLLSAIEQDVPVDLEEYLNSSLVIRYRFVTVDIETMWNTFEAARDLDSFEDGPTLELKLFEALSFEMRVVNVNHSYWSSGGTLVNNSPDYGTDPAAHNFATAMLKRDESVSARVWAAGDIYYITPVERGPIHVITQVDPEKMPAFD